MANLGLAGEGSFLANFALRPRHASDLQVSLQPPGDLEHLQLEQLPSLQEQQGFGPLSFIQPKRTQPRLKNSTEESVEDDSDDDPARVLEGGWPVANGAKLPHLCNLEPGRVSARARARTHPYQGPVSGPSSSRTATSETPESAVILCVPRRQGPGIQGCPRSG